MLRPCTRLPAVPYLPLWELRACLHNTSVTQGFQLTWPGCFPRSVHRRRESAHTPAQANPTLSLCTLTDVMDHVVFAFLKCFSWSWCLAGNTDSFENVSPCTHLKKKKKWMCTHWVAAHCRPLAFGFLRWPADLGQWPVVIVSNTPTCVLFSAYRKDSPLIGSLFTNKSCDKAAAYVGLACCVYLLWETRVSQ